MVLRYGGQRLLIVALGLGMATSGFAWGDCKASYNQALTVLDTTVEQASDNKHPNPDTFQADFQKSVDALKAEKCMTELSGLMRHIQAEQKKRPTDKGSAKPFMIQD